MLAIAWYIWEVKKKQKKKQSYTAGRVEPTASRFQADKKAPRTFATDSQIPDPKLVPTEPRLL